jgi:fibronectin type 3 domain-containing protein
VGARIEATLGAPNPALRVRGNIMIFGFRPAQKFVCAVVIGFLVAGCAGVVSTTGGGGTNQPPATPTGLQATAGNALVSLSWTASTGATGYSVKRATTNGGPYAAVATPSTTTYTDPSLTNGTTYYYVVAAINSAGASTNSSQVSATPTAPTTAPAVPAGLQAAAGNAQVSLSWSASTGATTYSLKRSTTNGGPYTQIATPSGTAYTDAGLTNGTAYFYVVAAVNSAGTSANSAQASATPTAPVTVPPVPTGLQATAGNAQVNLSWSASTGATSYILKRSTTSGGPYTQIATPSGTAYTDTALTNGTPYYYVVAAVNSAGTSANSSQASATPTAPVSIPAVPTGLQATAGNAQISLSWSAITGATSYSLRRSTTSGGPYTQIATPTTNSYVDTGLTNGTTYYYVVAAVNSAGSSANSAQVSATPSVPAGTQVQVIVDPLADRHPISPYVYGGAYPNAAADITNTGTTVVRWGGNATSTYNWQLHTDNADNDWYFEDFNYTEIGDADSAQFINDVKTAGSSPLMTMVMLPWVAKSAEGNGNGHWSFSVAKYGAQCATDPYNSDAGDGLETDCATPLTANPNDAYVPLLDQPGTNDPAGSIYRNQWAAALATAFGSAPHFYDMDNEIDIWGSTHRDIHPNPSAYNELRDTFLTESRALKTWDPAAIRLGPVSCCWWFYWNGENGNDKGAHAGVDFLPWWLNEVYWNDQIAGTRSLEMFDIHAYPDAPDNLSSFTLAEQQAAATRIYRDYWDPTYVSESSDINQVWTTQLQPNKTIPFRIPRMRAILNSIYPGTQISFTEWSAAFAGESDFSTALGDADAYGILGRERIDLASRWVAPVSTNPNYQALKLFRNYDGAHSTFQSISVSATNNGNPDLFSAYAAISSTGNQLTLLVLNKDPSNAAGVTFNLNSFNATSLTAYTLSQSSPTSIVASSSKPWSSAQSFAPYTATLLVINGSLAQSTTAEWDLNPDVIQVPASGTYTLAPKITSASGSVTLQSAQFDSGGGTITVNTSQVTTASNGAITVVAGSTSGFYHFTVTGTDSSGVAQTKGGWLLIGNPAATFTVTGNNQTAVPGSTITLSATLNPGSSGGTSSGASVLFSTDAGNFSGAAQQIAVTNSSGVASVTLTLPSSSGTAHITAEGQYALGHPVANFTATAQ